MIETVGRWGDGWRGDGRQLTASTRAALVRGLDALDAARVGLDAAARVGWVSAAGDGYRRVLLGVVVETVRLRGQLDAAHAPVLRHVGAADEARRTGGVDAPGCPGTRKP